MYRIKIVNDLYSDDETKLFSAEVLQQVLIGNLTKEQANGDIQINLASHMQIYLLMIEHRSI